MTSDLKPRTRSKKKANYRLYLILTCLAIAAYLFFFRGSTNLPSAGEKMESAASILTKGLSGTPKDKSKTSHEASATDKKTHELVHEMKKEAAAGGAAIEEVGLLGDSEEMAGPGSRESYLTSTHGDQAAKEVAVPASSNKSGKSRKEKSGAFDAADSLEVLLESYEMIVFSKTYCPHSKRAKTILEGYDIRPKPLIFELDVEDHGQELQKELAKKTGRQTVPNVVVHGTSIGGGDELAALDQTDKLVAKVRALSELVDITRKALRNE